ncbi:MAG: isocitrate/isopropylmalate dehydrogenase family protein [Pseudomonadota bacterium]
MSAPSTSTCTIAVLPGDGIGEEITRPCVELLQQAMRQLDLPPLNDIWYEAGAGAYTKHGNALPQDTIDGCRSADAILLAAMGDPTVRYPDGTEIIPQIDLRFELELYAGVRPVRSVPGVTGPLADPRANALDFVLVRESTEGLFASVGKGTRNDAQATDTQVVTKKGVERVSAYAFRLAEQRKARGHAGEVTSVDKANVFKSMAFWRDVFEAVAKDYPSIAQRSAYVDAVAMEMVRRPWIYDVMVTENMYGDILSDLAAGLIGGLGMAPSADIGDDHAVFQPCHGSAPDIAGTGKANPTAVFLSGAMMLEWLGVERSDPNLERAGGLMRAAVDDAFCDGTLVSTERGGTAGVQEITKAVGAAMAAVPVDDARIG